MVAAAKEWVEGQRFTVSLRQVFYHLVSAGRIPNLENTYKTLSERTAVARRADDFPDLSDNTRQVLRLPAYRDLSDYAYVAADRFHLDRTEGQAWQVVIGLEKRGMVDAAWEQFGQYGMRVVALGGYGSVTIDKQLARVLDQDGRPSVLAYAGDFDATGEDILRNLVDHVPFDKVERVALTVDQVAEYNLPENPGKSSDSRSRAFNEKYGFDPDVGVQVEVDALDPAILADLFQRAVEPYLDLSAFKAARDRERALRSRIRQRLSGAEDDDE